MTLMTTTKLSEHKAIALGEWQPAPAPYTLAQVIENLALMHGSQDLVWCRWVATDILERGIDALPTAQAQSRSPLEKAAPGLLNMLQRMVDETSDRTSAPCPLTLEHARAEIAKAVAS